MLIKKITVSPVKSQQKWKNDLCTEEQVTEINWKSAYTCTKSMKLRCFNFKLLNRRIATSVFLCKAGMYPTDHCTFCKQEPETLLHLFFKCSVTFFILGRYENLGQKKILPKVNLNLRFCFIGIGEKLVRWGY